MDDFCLAPLPVAFEPHWADERMLWLTAGSIAVSGALGWLAYWNGRRASKLAERSEKARKDELQKSRAERKQSVESQRAFEHELRLDDAISQLFVATSAYVSELAAWRQKCDEVLDDYLGYGNPDKFPHPDKPLHHAVTAALDNVLLRTKGSTSDYHYLHIACSDLLLQSPRIVVEVLPLFVSLTRELRTGEIKGEKFREDVTEQWQKYAPTSPGATE